MTLPQMVVLTGGALKHAAYLARNLQVDGAAMRTNIQNAHDVILAEAAVFALAKTMPRMEAEDLVKRACTAAVADNKGLIDVVQTLAGDSVPSGSVDWQSLARPENYLGVAQSLIDDVIERAEKFLG